MKVGWPEWWRRLGSPHAISREAWLLEAPAAIVMTLGMVPDGRVAPWLLVGVIATVMEGLAMLGVRRLVVRIHRRPPTPIGYVIGLVLAGLLRGLLLAGAATALALEHQLWLLPRLAGAVLGILVRFPIASLIADQVLRHRETIAALQRAAERQQALAIASADALRSYRARLLAETEAQVSTQVRKVATVVVDRNVTAAQLTRLVDDVVRPLGRELEHRGVEDDLLLGGISERLARPAFPVRAYVKGLVTARPFRPLATSVIVAITPAVVMAVYVGPTGMVQATAAGSISAGLVLLAARRVVGPWLATAPLVLAAPAVVTVWLAAVAAGVAVLRLMPPAPLLAPTPFQGPWVLVAYIVVSLATMLILALEASVDTQREAAERRLAEAVESAAWAAGRLRQRQWLEQRRLGHVVHSTVQARIVSLALQIRLNPPADIPAAITSVASGIHELLEEEQQASWSEALSRLRAVWDPSITLRVTVPRPATLALAGDPAAGQALAAVIGEAITNAVTHGGADTVEARVGLSRGILDVVVTDNGHADGAGSPGMGSQMLDNVCLSWSLCVEPAPTTLHARIACDPGGGDR